MQPKSAIPRLAFIGSSLFLVFLCGFAASHFQWMPIVSTALAQASTPPEHPEHNRHPARHDRAGVVTYDDVHPEQAGVTLLTSYWPDRWLPGLRLIDRQGTVLHSWDVDIMSIWPESPHRDGTEDFFRFPENYVHGSHLFDNGDVLFNVEYLGLVRMNAEGEVLWTLDRRTHHSIQRADDGSFWVCEIAMRGWTEETFARFPGLLPPLVEDRALQVSPDGEILRELSILDIVFNSEHRSVIWTAAPGRTHDMLHMNDVEPLSASMADQYPLFEAGDLLISLCWVNLVLVVDPDTHEVKWSTNGQASFWQHDPDFIGDGWISIFDNRPDGTLDGHFLGGSRLLAIQPHTGETRQIYPTLDGGSPDEQQFYTVTGGKAQLLPDGHWLISEAESARVIEVDPQGNTVWEWIHQRHQDGRTVSEVTEGTRYQISPDTVRGW